MRSPCLWRRGGASQWLTRILGPTAWTTTRRRTAGPARRVRRAPRVPSEMCGTRKACRRRPPRRSTPRPRPPRLSSVGRPQVWVDRSSVAATRALAATAADTEAVVGLVATAATSAAAAPTAAAPAPSTVMVAARVLADLHSRTPFGCSGMDTSRPTSGAGNSRMCARGAPTPARRCLSFWSRGEPTCCGVATASWSRGR
mmetsp:Transcript_153930/g.492091  ORF Transcript_153930/g.492091 Transcript_153930/m.492091 type:complete len:200 (-) Transcript_153930:839-1438(-)